MRPRGPESWERRRRAWSALQVRAPVVVDGKARDALTRLKAGSAGVPPAPRARRHAGTREAWYY